MLLGLPLLQWRNLSGLHRAHIYLVFVLQMDRWARYSLRFRPPVQCLFQGAPLHPHPRSCGHPLGPYQQALSSRFDKTVVLLVPTNYPIISYQSSHGHCHIHAIHSSCRILWHCWMKYLSFKDKFACLNC